jgi:hypothetical protein
MAVPPLTGASVAAGAVVGPPPVGAGVHAAAMIETAARMTKSFLAMIESLHTRWPAGCGLIIHP